MECSPLGVPVHRQVFPKGRVAITRILTNLYFVT